VYKKHLFSGSSMSNNTKAVVAAVALVIAGGGAYWHYSPYWAIKQMHTAAEQKDAQTFNEHVDYPKVRESLKGQLAAMMDDKMGHKMGDSGTSASGVENLGAALGLALINPMIDAMVRPKMVMRSMQAGKFQPLPTAAKDSAGPDDTTKKAEWELARFGANKLIAHTADPDGKNGTQMALVFERSGFANWKLTEMRFPSAE